MVLTKEEENFWMLCQIVLNIIPKNLRVYFKLQWDSKFPQNPWQDSAGNGQFLIGQIPQRSFTRFGYLRPALQAGDSNKWDPTALLFVFTNVGIVNQIERNELEKLRNIRNECFHSKNASMTTQDLLMKITHIQKAFAALKLQSGLAEIATIQNAPIQSQLSLQLQRQLDDERQLNDYYTKYLSEALNAIEEKVSVIAKRQEDMEDTLKGDEQRVQGASGTLSQLKQKFKDRLQSSSEKLKIKYKEEYQFHVITSVKGSDLEQREVALGKFAVDVTVVEGDQVTNLPNERSEFISKLHGIRSQHSVELKELVDRESKDRVSFVRGLAGIGKTVLTKQIALKWAEGTIFQEFSHLYLLKSRELINATCLDDFLKQEYFADIIPAGNKILFIIDGIDEVVDLKSKLNDKNSIIYQLLCKFSDRFVGSKVIMMGRPHVQATLKSREGNHLIGNMKIFEVVGLSEKSINEYFNLFTEKESQEKEEAAIQKAAIQNTRDLSQNIGVLMSIPHYLNTLCCFAILSEGKAISNTTELYVWLLFLFFKSHIKDVNDITEIFSGYYFDFIKTFGKISYQLLLKKTIVFKQADFTKEYKELTENEEMNKILNVFCIKVAGIKIVQKFQLKHLVLQEFFASLYCLIEKISPEELIKNNHFEIVTFICGFRGGMLKIHSKDEESILDIVGECLKSKENGEEEGRKFILGVFDALLDEVEDRRVRLEQALACTAEYLKPKYPNQPLIKEIIKGLIRFMPPDPYSPGLNYFESPSSIAQSNLVKLFEVAERNDLSEEFGNVCLDLDPLYNYNICRHFQYLGRVLVCVVNTVSVDKLYLLFNHRIYCNNVGLKDCEMVGDDFELRKLEEELQIKEEQSRLEMLVLSGCKIDEGNWSYIIEIISNVKKVALCGIEMKLCEWSELVDVIEEKKRSVTLKLWELTFAICNIDHQLIERIRNAGIAVVVKSDFLKVKLGDATEERIPDSAASVPDDLAESSVISVPQEQETEIRGQPSRHLPPAATAAVSTGAVKEIVVGSASAQVSPQLGRKDQHFYQQTDFIQKAMNEIKLNTGLCIVDGGTSKGFGALINFPPEEKRNCEAICLIPDNVVNANQFLRWKCNVKKAIFGKKPSKLTATVNNSDEKEDTRKFRISKLYHHDCQGLLCFLIKSKKATKYAVSIYDYDHVITESNKDEVVVFRCGQFERFKLAKIDGERDGILKVRIPEKETYGLKEKGKSYPVFKEFKHHFQFIGFLYLVSGTQCDVVLCKEIKTVLSQGNTPPERRLFNKSCTERKKLVVTERVETERVEAVKNRQGTAEDKMTINTGFCIVDSGTSKGFGALIKFTHGTKRSYEAICVIPDNVVNVNQFLQWTCNVKKPKFGNRPSKLTATVNYLKPYGKVGTQQCPISKLYHHDCRGLLCFQVKSEEAAKYAVSIYDYDNVITESNKDEVVVFRCGQFERFKLAKIDGECDGILKVHIPEKETHGLKEKGKSYPVFKESKHDIVYPFQFIGFLYLVSGTQCDVVLCKEIETVLSQDAAQPVLEGPIEKTANIKKADENAELLPLEGCTEKTANIKKAEEHVAQPVLEGPTEEIANIKKAEERRQ